MKKVLLLILLFIPVLNYAQNTFAPVGAQWWYGGNYGDYVDQQFPFTNSTWVDHVTSTGDTVIDGTPCRKLVTDIRTRSATNPDIIHTSSKTTFVYDNTDTTFVYSGNPGKFIPLYIYNVSEGDTVQLSGLFNFFGDTTFRYVVDSIRMELFDTSHLKTFYTRTLIDGKNHSVNWGLANVNSITGWYNYGKYTERLGGTLSKVSGLYPTICTHPTDGAQIINDGPFYGNLRCYSDATHTISLVSFPCDTLYSPGRLGITDVIGLPADLSVYPNPADEVMTIASNKPLSMDMSIVLYDLTGKEIRQMVLSKGKGKVNVSTGSLPNGLYMLRLSTDNGRYYHKIIVRH